MCTVITVSLLYLYVNGEVRFAEMIVFRLYTNNCYTPRFKGIQSSYGSYWFKNGLSYRDIVDGRSIGIDIINTMSVIGIRCNVNVKSYWCSCYVSIYFWHLGLLSEVRLSLGFSFKHVHWQYLKWSDVRVTYVSR